MSASTAEAPRVLAALAARVAATGEGLPERERTALCLREREHASHPAIATAPPTVVARAAPPGEQFCDPADPTCKP